MSVADALRARLRQHWEATKNPVDLPGNVPVLSGLAEGVLTPLRDMANTLGLAREGVGAASRVLTGAGEVLYDKNWSVDPVAIIQSFTPGGREMIANAGQAYDDTPGDPITRLLAANEAGAKGHGFAQGLVNAAHDPTLFIPGAGEESVAAGTAGRISSKLGIAAHSVNQILQGPEQLVMSAIGSQVQKRVLAPIAAKVGAEAVPAVTKAAEQAVQQVMPTATSAAPPVDAIAEYNAKRGFGAVSSFKDLFLDDPLVAAAVEKYERSKVRVADLRAQGAQAGNATLRTPLQEALGQQKAAGFQLSAARKAAQQRASAVTDLGQVASTDDVLGVSAQLSADAKARVNAARRAKKAPDLTAFAAKGDRSATVQAVASAVRDDPTVADYVARTYDRWPTNLLGKHSFSDPTERAVEHFFRAWAGDRGPEKTMLVHAASQAMGIPHTLPDDLASRWAEDGPALSAIADNVYRATQADIAHLPERVPLYRGANGDFLDQRDPLESWSAGKDVAEQYARDHGKSGRVLNATVDRRDIFSTGRTGPGDFTSNEYITGQRPGTALPAVKQSLFDLLDNPDDALELQSLFSGMDDSELADIMVAGQQNQPAIDYGDFINKNWDLARQGQITAHDVINAYVPAILSQRRKGQAVSSYLGNAKRAEQLGTKYPQLRQMLAEGVTQGGLEAGKYRPEDLAALMLHHTQEGRDLGSALRYGDPEAIHTAMDKFSAIWPDAGFMPGPGGNRSGGERGALLNAANDDVFSSVADMINRMATSGASGDEVAQVMRDYSAQNPSGGMTMLDRIGGGKSGFLTTNLGGPSATFDVRVQKAMKPGATIADYQRGLGILFPGDDPGLAHHKFWDSQSINKITGETGQTPHRGLAEAARQMQDGRIFESPFNITPQLADDLRGANTYTDDITADLSKRPPMSMEQQVRRRYQQDFLNGRAEQDIAVAKEQARGFYGKKVPSGEGFDQFWDHLTSRLEDLKTISMGVGDAIDARRIADSGMGILNGFALRGVKAGDQSYPESLLASKARALGLTKGQPRYDEAIAYGAAKGIKEPKAAVKAYAAHFLDTEAESFRMIGAGRPEDADALMPTYASITEGQPSLNQMGGGIHLLMDPENTDYVTSIHHPFMMASETVLPMHKGTSANFKGLWSPDRQEELAAAAGRPGFQQYGPEGQYEVSGSPIIGGPAATSAIRAASLIASDGGTIVKKAAQDPEAAAVELLRGGLLKQRGPESSLTRELAGNQSAKRTEAMVLNPGPENVRGILVKAQTPEGLKENVSAARYLAAKWGIGDTPIYVAYGPGGMKEPGVFELTPDGPVRSHLNKGRKALIDQVRGYGMTDLGVQPQIAQPANTAQSAMRWLLKNQMTTPGSSRLAMAGSGALAGGTVGALTADDDQSRMDAFKTGAVVGGAGALGLTTQAGHGLIQAFNPGSEVGQFAKNLVQSAWAAQKAAMDRSGVGIVRNLPSIWKVQMTSTLRNILQDEATTRLWLSNAGVRLRAMNDNWRSLIELYNLGKRDGFEALPVDAQDFLTKWGKEGYLPDVGANFTKENKAIVDKLSALDLAKGEGLLSALDPTQGGIPIAGGLLGLVKGYTRPFQQELFETINGFTRVAGRMAAFQDEAEKGMKVASLDFLQRLQSSGINVRGLDPQRGFTRVDVQRRVLSDQLANGVPAKQAKTYADMLAASWEDRVDKVLNLGEARAKDILGDFDKKLPGEKVAGSITPFIGYALRAYPRTAKMMLDHPGVSIALAALMFDEADAAKEEGLPGYLAGSIPVGKDTPLIGGAVDAMTGGEPGQAYLQPLNALSPVGGGMFAQADEQLPGQEDPNLYQKIKAVGDRVGFSASPVIGALTYAMNKDYAKPGRLSRTGAVEEALPGPQFPSLTEGPLNFIRTQAGGTAQTTSPLDRKIAELFLRATGVPIGDPSVDQDPDLAALRDSSLDPESPIYKQASSELLGSAVAKTAVGYASPVTATTLSDVQQQAGRDRQAVAALPPAAYSQDALQAVQSSQMYGPRQALMLALMQQANQGTQAESTPALAVNRGASQEARAKAALALWEAQHQSAKGTPFYADAHRELQSLLGIQ